MKIVIILLAIIMVVMLGLAYLKGIYSPGHKDYDWSQMEVTNCGTHNYHRLVTRLWKMNI